MKYRPRILCSSWCALAGQRPGDFRNGEHPNAGWSLAGSSSRANALLLVLLLLLVWLNQTLGAPVYTTNSFFFTYANRSALLADGWSFIATTPVPYQVAQNARNTEGANGVGVSYDQTAHPGVLRIPVDGGDLWSTANNSGNTLFRSLPTNWVSARLSFSFQPTQNYQQAALLLYWDDDNYIGVSHAFNGNERVAMVQEISANQTLVNAAAVTAGTLMLRLDRDLNTGNVTGLYSLDGANWTSLGQVWQSYLSPQLAIFSGGSSTGYPSADVQQVDVVTTDTLPAPVLEMQPQDLVFNCIAGQSCTNVQQLRVVVPSQDVPLPWTAVSLVPWCTVANGGGFTPGFCDIGVNPSGLGPGVYRGSVQLTAPGATVTNANVTLVVNPAGRAAIATWRNGQRAALSVSVDDSNGTAFDELSTNGFAGTYMLWGNTPIPSFCASYYQAGMELGTHTVTHPCYFLDEAQMRWEFENNVAMITGATPASQAQVISFAWPCGSYNLLGGMVAADYFLSARGYNWNQLEDASPYNLMNLKSFNSHEHAPSPPADLKTVVDAAITQGKWFNLVLHAVDDDDGAIGYSVGKDIWVAPIGSVVKYLLQRDRAVITNYLETASQVSFDCYRLSLRSSSKRNFEAAFGPQDPLTIQVDITGVPSIYGLTVNGTNTSYATKVSGTRTLLQFNLQVADTPQSVVLRTTSNISPPTVSLSYQSASNQVQLLFNGTANHSYQVQWAPSVLGPWTTLQTLVATSDGPVVYNGPGPAASAAFFRVYAP